MSEPEAKQLYRSRKNRVIFGVCGGLGEYFGIEPIIFRIIFLALIFGAGSGVLLYLLLAILIPVTPLTESEDGKIISLDFSERINGLVSEFKELGEVSAHKRNTLGWAIIILGGFFILHELVPWRIFSWGVFWALLIIVAGIFILRDRGGKSTKPKAAKAAAAEHLPPHPQVETLYHPRIVKEVHHHYQRGGIFRLFFGLILIMVGSAFIAQNFNLVPGLTIDLSSVFRLWPILIILAGLSLLSRGTWIGVTLSTLMIIALIVFVGTFFFWPSAPAELNKYNFNIPKNVAATRGEVVVEAGVAVINIKGGTGALVSGSAESNVSTLSSESSLNNDSQIARIELRGDIRRFGGKLINNLDILLTEDMPMALKVNSSASVLHLDASTVALENLKLNTGASKVNVILGDKANEANVEIMAGASTIELNVPRNVGTKIQASGGITGKNFYEFKQLNSTEFESDEYDRSVKKINIKIDAGVSSVSVFRR